MLTNQYQKVKKLCIEYRRDLFTAAVIFLVGMIGFGLGRLSVIWPKPFPVHVFEEEGARTLDQNNAALIIGEQKQAQENDTMPSLPQGFVGSKNGSSYHYPWCPGAKKIKEENKITFATREEAKQKGYKPAGNCPGL